MKIGCGDITWNTFARARGIEFTREQILSEIAQAGFEGSPMSVRDQRAPQDILAEYDRFGLQPAPGYLGASFWDPEQEQEIYERAKQAAWISGQVGVTELYVAASPLTRREAAGHVRPEDAMSDEEFQQFARVLDQVGDICLAYGVKACLHNHVGSVIETRAEIDKLFNLVDRDRVFQGPDLGHLAWAGADARQFCEDYAYDILSVHVKDIDPQVLEQGVAESWDYGTFSAHGIFAELGEGFVDLPGAFDILKRAGYDGWLIVETDVTQLDSPLASARVSREYLASLGL
jgi:inosose dehydratase